jgi:hydroxymethylbilane synthase
VAVHSLKDLPTESAAGLHLAAVPPRGDTADALVLPASCAEPFDLDSLPARARIGTSSLRRQAQLRHRRPDLETADVRGNVETRVRKLDAGDYDALVLAVAGLRRLELTPRISRVLEPPLMYPAVGQGALGIECREDDSSLRALLAKTDDRATHQAVIAERSLLARLRAGCHAPVGVTTRLEMGELVLEGVVLSADGRQRVQALGRAPASDAEALGRTVADELLSQGADRLIAR